MSNEDFIVTWNIGDESGSADGFRSRTAAERFIRHVCIPADPGKQYMILNRYSPGI